MAKGASRREEGMCKLMINDVVVRDVISQDIRQTRKAGTRGEEARQGEEESVNDMVRKGVYNRRHWMMIGVCV